jgi:glyoxylase-like metal-dependent hydrolase (beta-lactamase superfamily II)
VRPEDVTDIIISHIHWDHVDGAEYENLAKHMSIAALFARADTVSNLEAQDRVRQLASDPKFILPGHDPEIFGVPESGERRGRDQITPRPR